MIADFGGQMEQQKTILLVDDNKENIHILLNLLNEYDLLVALEGNQAIEIAQNEKIDLILLDIVMPEIDGYQVCSALKQNEATKHIPIIFSTAKTDEDSIEKAYDTGGVDYITKPYKPKEILARVKTHLQIQDLIGHLDHLSSHDAMTGIYNRRMFFKEASRQIKKKALSLYAMVIDVDKFKNINDTYGHPTGDKVIIQVAEEMKLHCSGDSVFGRIGGEEFAAVIHASSEENALSRVEGLRKRIEKLEFISEDGLTFNTSISIGMVKKNDSHSDINRLIKEADDALYLSKTSGRNRCTFTGGAK